MESVSINTIHKRRNRRGRDFKHNLIPAHLPGYLSPSKRFEELVIENMSPFYTRFSKQLADLEVLVENVPPSAHLLSQTVLGNYFPKNKEFSQRLVLYRLPIESRARNLDELSEIIFKVILDNLASGLGVSSKTLEELL